MELVHEKTNFVIFLILVISSSTLLATNSKCYSIANKVKDASIFYRSLFEKKMAEISLICQNSDGNFSITNYDNGVSFVYSGVLQHLLTVEINRPQQIIKKSSRPEVNEFSESKPSDWR